MKPPLWRISPQDNYYSCPPIHKSTQ